MNTTPATPPAPSPRLLRAISAAHTFGRLEKSLAALPGSLTLSPLNSRAFSALQSAQEMAQKAETMRREALQALAVELTEPGDGWNEAELLAALDNPIARE